MNGTVTGGWNFVWSAYLITGALLAVYAARTVILFHRARKQLTTHEGVSAVTPRE